MSVKNFTLVTGFLFLILGLLHVTRILYAWDAIIGGWSLPLWISGVLVIFAFFLSFQAFVINRRS